MATGGRGRAKRRGSWDGWWLVPGGSSSLIIEWGGAPAEMTGKSVIGLMLSSVRRVFQGGNHARDMVRLERTN